MNERRAFGAGVAATGTHVHAPKPAAPLLPVEDAARPTEVQGGDH